MPTAYVTDDTQKYSSYLIKDRSWDGTIRGNVMQASTNLPFINFNNASCPGWEVRDNVVHGCNDIVAQGNSLPAIQFNNRRSAFTTALPNPVTEAVSIFEWQRTNATLARLVQVPLQSTVLLALMVVFALSRLPGCLPDNFSAAYALMFCAGVYFPGRLAGWLPLSVMLVTDLGINLYYQQNMSFSVFVATPFVFLGANYVAYAALIWLGRRFSSRNADQALTPP